MTQIKLEEKIEELTQKYDVYNVMTEDMMKELAAYVREETIKQIFVEGFAVAGERIEDNDIVVYKDGKLWKARQSDL